MSKALSSFLDFNNLKAHKLIITKWLVLFISLGLIAFLYSQTVKPLLTDREAILKETLYAKELQNSILTTVTLNQLRSVHNFDIINNQAYQLQQTLMTISHHEGIIQSPQLQTKIQQLINATQQQLTFIENFKTRRSVIQNSVNYLPDAYKFCADSLSSQQSLENIKQIQDLAQEALILGLTTVQSGDQQQASKLKQTITEFANNELNGSCKNFIQHASLLADYLPQGQLNFEKIHSLAINKQIQEFYSLLEREVSESLEDNDIYYLFITLFSLLLLFYIVRTLNSLYQTNEELHTTLLELAEQQKLYAALVHSNEVMTTATEQSELCQQICETLVNYTNIDSSWIGLINETTQTLTPDCCSGQSKDELLKMTISLQDDNLPEHWNILQAYHSGQTVINQHSDSSDASSTWVKHAFLSEIQGSATLPIKHQGKVIGFLVTYTLQDNFFNTEIQQLLSQLADNISKAIEGIKLAKVQKQQQQDLAVAAIAFDSHESILITDADQKIIRANKAFTNTTGYSQAEVISRTPSILKSGLHNQAFYQELWDTLNKTGKWQGEVWNRKKDGTLFPNLQTITSLFDSKGKVSHYVSHAVDLTKDKASQREINYLHNHDNLTELPNRNLLLERIEQQLEQNQQLYSVLFAINIHRFKMINESLGHAAGDELLKQIANRLKTLSFDRTVDITAARIGNDEFCLLCLTDFETTEHITHESRTIASVIQACLQQDFVIFDNQVVVNTAVGVTTFQPNQLGDGTHSAEEVLQEAESALQRANLNPIQPVQFFEHSMQEQAQRRLILETELRNAMQNRQFILHFQPQISLNSGKTIGVEALIRWHHSDKLTPPVEFIPVLEDTGLIIPVGYWIIEQAITSTQQMHQHHPELMVAINLSAIQFNDPDLFDNITKILDEHDYPADKLELEITESILMTDIEQAISKLNQFAALGIKIAIDDFGTGYSSLSYLKRFPINRLKIDKSFIDSIAEEQQSDYAIVQATIQMAKALNFHTIAEGVEHKEQIEKLIELDCDEVQGYYYSKPLPQKELKHFLSEH